MKSHLPHSRLRALKDEYNRGLGRVANGFVHFFVVLGIGQGFLYTNRHLNHIPFGNACKFTVYVILLTKIPWIRKYQIPLQFRRLKKQHKLHAEDETTSQIHPGWLLHGEVSKVAQVPRGHAQDKANICFLTTDTRNIRNCILRTCEVGVV